MLFALPVKLAHDLRAADVDEICVRFVCDSFRHECFPCSGRAVEQDTFWWVDAELLEDLRVPQRQLDQLSYHPELSLQTADILVGHVRNRTVRCHSRFLF